MGVERAPVTGSGAAPAWTARVSKPCTILCEVAGRSLTRRASGGSGGRLRMMPLLTPLHDNSPPSRPNSIFGQRFMTTSIPAASALAAAASLRMPSHPHHLGADRDRVPDNRRRLAGSAEHVD